MAWRLLKANRPKQCKQMDEESLKEFLDDIGEDYTWQEEQETQKLLKERMPKATTYQEAEAIFEKTRVEIRERLFAELQAQVSPEA